MIEFRDGGGKWLAVVAKNLVYHTSENFFKGIALSGISYYKEPINKLSFSFSLDTIIHNGISDVQKFLCGKHGEVVSSDEDYSSPYSVDIIITDGLHSVSAKRFRYETIDYNLGTNHCSVTGIYAI